MSSSAIVWHNGRSHIAEQHAPNDRNHSGHSFQAWRQLRRHLKFQTVRSDSLLIHTHSPSFQEFDTWHDEQISTDEVGGDEVERDAS